MNYLLKVLLVIFSWNNLQNLSHFFTVSVKDNFCSLEKKILEVDEALSSLILLEQSQLLLSDSKMVEKGKLRVVLDKLFVMKERAKTQ